MKQKKSLVLVVDDIQSNIEFILDILTLEENTEVIGVNDGQATLDFVAKRTPDLILLDISMPGMDGFEVCRRLKADSDYAQIPIIFLTARVQKEDTIHGFELGAVDYIAKPFNLNELLSRVNTHLELSHKTKELHNINARLEEKVQQRTRQLLDSNKNLSEANSKLEEAYEELTSLDQAKNDFIAHINHELRTPLNGILGYTSILEATNLPSESKGYIHSINTLVSRLIKVAEISLLLTELRTVDNRIAFKKIVLTDIIEDALNNEEIAIKNVHVNIQQNEKSQMVLGEPRLLSLCLSMIVDNAVKYSPENGNIQIVTENNDQFISVIIIDEGPGFSETAFSRLFDLFTADNLDYRAHGFGMGLATSKRIIDLLGGRIDIKNNETKGASVNIFLKKPTP